MDLDISTDRLDSPIVDAHVHILSDEILHAVRDWFAREVSWTPPDVTTTEIAAFIDAQLAGEENLDDVGY